MFTNELIITAEEKRFKTIMEILYKLQTTDIQIIITVIEIEIIENDVIIVFTYTHSCRLSHTNENNLYY